MSGPQCKWAMLSKGYSLSLSLLLLLLLAFSPLSPSSPPSSLPHMLDHSESFGWGTGEVPSTNTRTSTGKTTCGVCSADAGVCHALKAAGLRVGGEGAFNTVCAFFELPTPPHNPSVQLLFGWLTAFRNPRGFNLRATVYPAPFVRDSPHTFATGKRALLPHIRFSESGAEGAQNGPFWAILGPILTRFDLSRWRLSPLTPHTNTPPPQHHYHLGVETMFFCFFQGC